MENYSLMVIGIYPPITMAGWCNNHLEKYKFVNGKDDIPYMKWKIYKTCLKPPTRWLYQVISTYNWICMHFQQNHFPQPMSSLISNHLQVIDYSGIKDWMLHFNNQVMGYWTICLTIYIYIYSDGIILVNPL